MIMCDVEFQTGYEGEDQERISLATEQMVFLVVPRVGEVVFAPSDSKADRDHAVYTVEAVLHHHAGEPTGEGLTTGAITLIVFDSVPLPGDMQDDDDEEEDE